MLKLPVKYPIVDENIDLSEYAKKSDVDALDASLDNKAEKKDVEELSSQLDKIETNKASVENLNEVQSQINDLVLGAVGDGNNAEVVQSRGGYKLLNDRLTKDYVNKYTMITPSWIDGYFINNNGAKGELAGYSISNNIRVDNYKKILLKNVKGNSIVSVVSFCTSDNEIIKTNVISADTEFYQLDIPKEASSFVLCKNNSHEYTTYFDKESKENDIIELNNKITWTDGYFISADGSIIANDSFKCSNLIKAEKGTTIKGLTRIENFPNIAFYDENGVFIKAIKNVNYYEINDIENPIFYYRLCTNKKYNIPYVVLNFKKYYENAKELANISEFISYNNGYIDNNGDFQPPLAKFVYTNYLKAIEGTKIFNIVSNDSFPNIAFYDEEFRFVRSINSIESYEIKGLEEKIKYFIVSTSNKNLIIQVPQKYFYNAPQLADNKKYKINVPKYIDVVVNTENTIYIDNLLLSKNATFSVNFTHELVDNAIQFTPTSNGNLFMRIQERDADFRLVTETNPIIRVVNKTDGNNISKNILIIGDSLIDNQYVAKETYRLLSESGATFNQLGTRGVEGGRHEGHGGWSWEDYFKESYNGVTNVFYNNGGLDFKNYCTVNNYSGIDYCIIALGTNDVRQGNTTSEYFADNYIDSIIENAKNFIDKLLEDYPNCKIAIGLPSVGGDLITKNSNAFQYKMKKLIAKYIEVFDNGVYHANVTTVAHGLFINRRLGYTFTNKKVSNRFPDNSVNVITDYIHSNPNGYYCYADSFYAKIRSWLSGNL